MDRGYQHSVTEKLLSEINKNSWKLEIFAPETKQQGRKRMLPFVTQHQPVVPLLSTIIL